ncbi:MAG: sporulation membrane protein YtaF [Bacillota bacterium]
MELLTITLFALALNMDAFATGVAYGMRRIKIPLASLLIISGLSVLAITFSMLAGNLLASFVPDAFARRLGGFTLLFIGSLFVWQSLRRNSVHAADHTTETRTLLRIRIYSLDLVIHVLREPHRADLDRSGEISTPEAFLLGAALAMDSFGAGFAVSMLGFDLALTAALVGIGHLALTYLGLLAGRGFSATWLGKQFSVLPGCILIFLGLAKLL